VTVDSNVHTSQILGFWNPRHIDIHVRPQFVDRVHEVHHCVSVVQVVADPAVQPCQNVAGVGTDLDFRDGAALPKQHGLSNCPKFSDVVTAALQGLFDQNLTGLIGHYDPHLTC